MQYNDNVLEQNLIDAGCGEQFIKHFMTLNSEQKISEMLSLLEKQRKNLLAVVHAEERKIYCLDYLVNKIKKCP